MNTKIREDQLTYIDVHGAFIGSLDEDRHPHLSTYIVNLRLSRSIQVSVEPGPTPCVP